MSCFRALPIIFLAFLAFQQPVHGQGLNGTYRTTSSYGGNYSNMPSGNAWQIPGYSPYNATTPNYYGPNYNYYGSSPNYYSSGPNYSQFGSGNTRYDRRAHEWTQAMQKLYPNAPYNYFNYSMAGSDLNNPLSLYGAASQVPTVFNPQYIAGGSSYQVQMQRYASPNYYAPYQYMPVVK